jgi:hypothetical protein
MTGPEQPIGLDQIAADDLLLDALGGGSTPESDDPAVTMLAAWRADLSDGVPEASRPTPMPAPDRSRQRRLTRMVLGAAAAAVFAAGLAVTAHQAQPGSPLWSVSKVVYPERSELVAAEKAIADARTAAAAGRDADARRLLATATTHVANIDDRAVADQLRKEIDAILRALASPPPPATPQASSPRPTVAPTTPAPAQPPATPAPAPSSSPSPSQGGLLPDLPLPPLSSIIPG